MDFRKSLSIDLAIVAVVIIGIFFVRADIRRRVDKISELSQEINKKSVSFGKLSDLSAQKNKATKYLEQMSVFLMNKDQFFLNFSKDVSIMAQQNGITSQVTFKEEIPPTNMEPRKTSILLVLSGPVKPDNFKNFLALLENSKYFIKFESIDFNQSGNNINVNLSGKAFSF